MELDSDIVKEYCVCLIDILDQSKRLQNWSEIPIDPASEKYLDTIRKSAGTVIALNQNFKIAFENYLKAYKDENISSEQKKIH